VALAQDGRAALAAAQRARPALVVSDVMMPRLDGFELLRAMRDDPDLGEIPVILLSARAGDEATVAGLEAGADDYLVKPFSSRELIARVRTHLALAQQREELAHARDAAEAANRELSSFSYSVAHDLRAPLRHIDGFTMALIEDHRGSLDPDAMGLLDRVRRSAQRMSSLIDGLLDLARITQGELRCEQVDISALARAAIARLASGQPDRQVEVAIQEGITGQGDPRLLMVVLDNLVGNAWKFTRKRERARIEFGTTTTGRQPIYFVRDNGAGFDMSYSEKLFGAFQRLHAAHDFEGTGIGLATVQRVINRHRGRVWANGKVNQGATFFFTLFEHDRGADSTRSA
jgi:light-regulated signal transduction histidine kinase (bacteriophytochrome)